MRLRPFLLCAFLVACSSEDGCPGPGLQFSVLPDFGNCNRGGSASTQISLDGQDGELYIQTSNLPDGVTDRWDIDLEMRSRGTMRFNCSQSAAPGSYDLRLSPYVVSHEGDTFDDLHYRLQVQ